MNTFSPIWRSRVGRSAITLAALTAIASLAVPPGKSGLAAYLDIPNPLPVVGAFWQTTQPVSLSSLPALPAGANTIGAVVPANNPVGAASIATAQASIGTSAALIVAARTGAVGSGRVAVTIFNSGSAILYVGGAGVTSSTGFAVPAGAAMTVNASAAIYGAAASGTLIVYVMETF